MRKLFIPIATVLLLLVMTKKSTGSIHLIHSYTHWSRTLDIKGHETGNLSVSRFQVIEAP